MLRTDWHHEVDKVQQRLKNEDKRRMSDLEETVDSGSD